MTLPACLLVHAGSRAQRMFTAVQLMARLACMPACLPSCLPACHARTHAHMLLLCTYRLIIAVVYQAVLATRCKKWYAKHQYDSTAGVNAGVGLSGIIVMVLTSLEAASVHVGPQPTTNCTNVSLPGERVCVPLALALALALALRWRAGMCVVRCVFCAGGSSSGVVVP